MKVFFSASPRGVKEFGAYYRKIFNELQSMGLANIDDDVVNVTYPDLVARKTKDAKAYNSYANKKLHDVQDADICAFEVSEPSLAIGFLVQRALEFGKPVIVLYYKDHLPLVFAGLEDDKLLVKSYTERTLKKVVLEAVEQARQRRDRRFNFFISPRLLEYIESTSRDLGITKSKFIRNLILEHMRKASSASQ